MIALVLGTVLAVGALAFVLAPLFSESRVPAAPFHPRDVGASDPGAERAMAVEALREIEFDRATGKLSDADYHNLKRTYTQQAVDAMRRADAADRAPVAAVSLDQEVEAAILAHRARPFHCARCGPRPERDAIYCSECGLFLPGRCDACGAPVAEPGARFCSSCGEVLAA